MYHLAIGINHHLLAGAQTLELSFSQRYHGYSPAIENTADHRPGGQYRLGVDVDDGRRCLADPQQLQNDQGGRAGPLAVGKGQHFAANLLTEKFMARIDNTPAGRIHPTPEADWSGGDQNLSARPAWRDFASMQTHRHTGRLRHIFPRTADSTHSFKLP